MIIIIAGCNHLRQRRTLSITASAPHRGLDLPPPYSLVTLREAGDAFAHACSIAGGQGAGTLVWVRRFDVAEFAVVLEPEETLREARRAFYVGMNALADALTGLAPPHMAISFDWPDALRIDGVLVGGGRFGWPAGDEDRVPEWLVFAATVRTAVIRASDPGMRPLLGGLDELGFEAIDAGEIVASFARHLLAGFHDWSEEGFEAVEERYRARLAPGWQSAGELTQGPAREEDGPFQIGGRMHESDHLRDALLSPSWRDPRTGLPWL